MSQFKNKTLLFVYTVLILQISISAVASSSHYSIDPNCVKEESKNSQLREADFIWEYTLDLMREAFNKIYQSDEKRLPARAYWDPIRGALVLPYLPERGGNVVLNDQFIKNLSGHIESAFKNKYIDAVIFPDMGHSHFLIPNKIWSAKYDKYQVSRFSQMYTDLFSDIELKILYHTAEQLKLLDENRKVINDPKIQWRHKTRNVVGLNNGSNKLLVLKNPESAVNTVNALAGHFWYGAGYNISSNKNGCLQYKKENQIFRFDISLFDLQ